MVEIPLDKGEGYTFSMKRRRLAKRKHLLWFLYYKLLRSSTRFTLDGVEYPYFYHRYNRSWRNERVVEVPIIKHILDSIPGARVLEVGNVLSHYFPIKHDIVDKYEKAEGVVNEDVADLDRFGRYDLIVSISTLEHVGWDEEPRDPEKIPRAVETLKRCLAPGGRLVATLPIGYNPELDRMLDRGAIPFSGIGYLKRVSPDNEWKQVSWEEVRDSVYNRPYPAANALAVATVEG